MEIKGSQGLVLGISSFSGEQNFLSCTIYFEQWQYQLMQPSYGNKKDKIDPLQKFSRYYMFLATFYQKSWKWIVISPRLNCQTGRHDWQKRGVKTRYIEYRIQTFQSTWTAPSVLRRNSAMLVAHSGDLVLLLEKAYLALWLVEKVHFEIYVHDRNPLVRAPDRRVLSEKLILEFIKRCEEKPILLTRRSFSSVSITFDLWMCRDCEDIFELTAHGMDENSKEHKVHLSMSECSCTIRVFLANVLRRELQQKL